MYVGGAARNNNNDYSPLCRVGHTLSDEIYRQFGGAVGTPVAVGIAHLETIVSLQTGKCNHL